MKDRDIAEQEKKIMEKIISLSKTYDMEILELECARSFEKSCLIVTSEMHKDAKRMTVMEYESALAILNERSKSLKNIKSR